MTERKIRVLVVDDSMVNRKKVSEVLRADPGIEVVGTATDPYVARDKILELEPDVMVLDTELPKMDGLTFLKILMKQHPIPVVAMTPQSKTGSRHALGALEAGAVDVVMKLASDIFTPEAGPELIAKIKAAANPDARPAVGAPISNLSVPSRPAAASPARLPSGLMKYHPRQVILLGASTGGTEALRDVLAQLPGDMPGICIVQHIPEDFSRPFAERLNGASALEVREARDGDLVRPGLALIAPGDLHMTIHQHGHEGFHVQVRPGEKHGHHRPSVDLLFQSAAAIMGLRAVAGLLTGMGRDGADGLLALRRAGARTFAQDEQSCVVFGMPRAAMENGAAEKMVALPNIATHIVRLAGLASVAKAD
jgi:two-component system chemotaxis response regulator CheB